MQRRFLIKHFLLIQGNSTFFHPKPEETVSNVWAKHASLPAGTRYEKEQATRGAISAESQMSRKGPQAERNERNANDPKGDLCCGYTFSENNWISPILLCVLILSHLFKISFAVFITEKSEQD